MAQGQSQLQTDSTVGPPESDSRLLVGIPAFNEEVGIGSVVLATKQQSTDVLVVDDGSTDNTAAIAREAGVNVIEHDENRGKGAAIKTILSEAQREDFDALVMLDGDGQHIPEDIPEVAAPVLDGESDIVIGSRYLESGEDETPLYRRFGQKTLDLLTTGRPGVR